eukprot:5886420-Pleurochrysis_carterae.AAC.1
MPRIKSSAALVVASWQQGHKAARCMSAAEPASFHRLRGRRGGFFRRSSTGRTLGRRERGALTPQALGQPLVLGRCARDDAN